MTGYWLRRFAQSLFVLLLMSAVVYTLIGLMPGDPIDLMIASDPRLTSEDAQRLKALYGLDRPLWERYLRWLATALSGDMGYSRLFSKPVLETMTAPLLNSLLLMGTSLALALILGAALGLLAVYKPHGLADAAVNAFSFAAVSLPVFWLGLMLMALFSVKLGWLPASGAGEVGEDSGIVDRLRHLILPATALAIPGVGKYARYLRAGLLEALSQDYIRTARARGAGRWRVLTAHALRNALIPVATLLGLDLGNIVSGALITETIFAYPGMGRLIYDSIMGNDYNLALAGLLLATLLTLGGNLLADLAYAALDPRISRK